MRILGIDPGSRVSGYAVLELKNNKLDYLSSGIIKPDTSGDFFRRLPEIFLKFKGVFDKYGVDHLAIETLIHVKNVASLAKLAQARGAMLASIGDSSIEVFEYTPNKIKASVAGFGHADKQMIHYSIEQILRCKIKCSTFDESDALAIAITHGIELIHGSPLKKHFGNSLFSRKSGSLAASINPNKLKK